MQAVQNQVPLSSVAHPTKNIPVRLQRSRSDVQTTAASARSVAVCHLVDPQHGYAKLLHANRFATSPRAVRTEPRQCHAVIEGLPNRAKTFRIRRSRK